MAARQEPAPSRRGGSASRRRSRHSVADTDPLYWARARAAESDAASDPFGRGGDREAATEEFPPVGAEWSGRLPLPTPPGLPALSAWSVDDRGEATTDSLPVLRQDEPVLRRDDAATTVDLPAVPSAAETVDHREHPLALVPHRPERSALARRGYTGRHRPPETAAPARLGLSTAGMTVAVGVLGVTLAMLHAQPTTRADHAAPPLSAVSPTAPDPAVSGPEGASTSPQPTPGPGEQHLIPRPATTPGGTPAATPGANRPGDPAVAPRAPAPAGGDEAEDEEPATSNTPRRPAGRPTRPSRPGTASRPTPTCAADVAGGGAVRTQALAGDVTVSPTGTTGTPQADPDETPAEPTEPTTEEPTGEPSPSAAAGCR